MDHMKTFGALTRDEQMRAQFNAWVQDRGCDTDGAWSAWQACWNLRQTNEPTFPDLPQPIDLLEWTDTALSEVHLFTDEQMREYARAAVLANAASCGKPVAWRFRWKHLGPDAPWKLADYEPDQLGLEIEPLAVPSTSCQALAIERRRYAELFAAYAEVCADAALSRQADAPKETPGTQPG